MNIQSHRSALQGDCHPMLHCLPIYEDSGIDTDSDAIGEGFLLPFALPKSVNKAEHPILHLPEHLPCCIHISLEA